MTSRAATAAPEHGDSAAVRAAARLLAEEGDAALYQGRHDEALRLFRMAEELFHAPTLVLAMAQAEVRLGRWAAARGHYRAVIDEDLGADVNPAFRAAQQTAASELAALEPRIPTLVLELRGASPRAEVRLDGRPRPLEAFTRPVFLDEGPHEVVVIDGATVVAKKLALAERERRVLTIDLGSRRGRGARGGVADEVSTGGAPSIGWWWGASALALGGAGLVAGTVTGVLALEDADAVKASCDQGRDCDPMLRGREDDARAFAAAATASFIVGGTLVAAGTTLLVLDAKLPGAPSSVGLRVGPTGASLHGRF
ncbi:MAG: hypothetical protein AAGN82_09670 [Myxococcota bacterium]